MANDSMDSGLGEAISSYQPKVLDEQQWARFRDDAAAMVLKLHNPTPHRAVHRLSHLAAYLADVAHTQPEANLAQLLTRAQIDGYRHRAAGQMAKNTWENRQAALNNFLKVKEGRAHGQPPRRKQETHREPYGEAMLIRLLAAAASCPSAKAAAFARTIGCVLAGVELPSDGDEIDVDVEGGCIEVCGLVWTAPVGLPLPASGELTVSDVAAGRVWARTALDERIDLRRLNLSALTMLASGHPAMSMLTRAGLGRDRLTSVMHAAERPDAETTKAWLRGG